MYTIVANLIVLSKYVPRGGLFDLICKILNSSIPVIDKVSNLDSFHRFISNASITPDSFAISAFETFAPSLVEHYKSIAAPPSLNLCRVMLCFCTIPSLNPILYSSGLSKQFHNNFLSKRKLPAHVIEYAHLSLEILQTHSDLSNIPHLDEKISHFLTPQKKLKPKQVTYLSPALQIHFANSQTKHFLNKCFLDTYDKPGQAFMFGLFHLSSTRFIYFRFGFSYVTELVEECELKILDKKRDLDETFALVSDLEKKRNLLLLNFQFKKLQLL